MGRRGSAGPGGGPVLASSTGSRTRSLGLVGLAIVGSGLLVNAYLAIIARNISAAEYAYFGAFWSLALVTWPPRLAGRWPSRSRTKVGTSATSRAMVRRCSTGSSDTG